MATKTISWNTGSGNITLTYQGQGDGTITVNSDPNNLGSARSQVINIETTAGSPVVVKNFTINQEACSFPVGDIRNFAYTGNVQSVLLPAGQYKLQCWGAQGGSCSSGYAGGKGGYSEGVLTLTSPTTVYIFVGSQGGQSGNGGWNGGGGGSGSSSYSSGNEYGSSTFGCGGGATDIALVTSSMSYSSYRNNRSAASLLSRMIVAGGGSGGAYGYQEVTTTQVLYWNISYYSGSSSYSGGTENDAITIYHDSSGGTGFASINLTGCTFPVTVNFDAETGVGDSGIYLFSSPNASPVWESDITGSSEQRLVRIKSDGSYSFTATDTSRPYIGFYLEDIRVGRKLVIDITSYTPEKTTSSTSSDSKAGYVGGGTNGGGYSSSYYGKQNGAGSNGSFGFGANQTVTNYRYGAGCGGGGWYGGGNSYSDSGLSTIRCSGGGSGFVNTAANASYRPSGYTGLQLDSGETKAGNTSFPSTSGGTETGHSGNGYAKITRIS